MEKKSGLNLRELAARLLQKVATEMSVLDCTVRVCIKGTHVIFADSDMVVDVCDEANAMATLLEMSGRSQRGRSDLRRAGDGCLALEQ
jgi:hypothetical protein